MTLDFQMQQAPFKFGLDEGVDPKQAPIGTLLVAKNVEWVKSGRAQKRDGTSCLIRNAYLTDGTLDTGFTLATKTARRLFTRGTDLCLIFGEYLYARMVSNVNGAWLRVDRVPNVGLTWSGAIDTTAGIAAIDSEYSAAYTVTAWITGDPHAATTGALYVQIKDGGSDSVLLPAKQLSASGNYFVRVLKFTDGTFVVLTTNAGNLVAYRIAVADVPQVAAGTNLRVDVGANPMMDACSLGSTIVVLYNTTSPDVHMYSYNSALVVQQNRQVQAIAGNLRCSITGAAGENVCVAYYTTGSDLRVAVHDPATLVQTAGPTTVENLAASGLYAVGVCRRSATRFVLAYTTTGANTWLTKSYDVTSGAVVTANTEKGTYGVRMTTKPFALDSRIYFIGNDWPNLGAATFKGSHAHLFECEVNATTAPLGGALFIPQRHVGKIDHLIGGCPAAGALSKGSAVSTSEVEVTVPVVSVLPAANLLGWRQGAKRVRATVNTAVPKDMWRGVSYGQEAYFAGGVLGVYDSRSVFEYGFSRAVAWFRPPVVANVATGLGLGNYIYLTHLEYRSAVNVLHRGATATVSIATSGAGPAYSLQHDWINYNVTHKQTTDTGFSTSAPLQLTMPVYRSVVGGDQYYRLTIEPSTNTVAIDPRAGGATLTDARPDANIDGANYALTSRPGPYTNGDIKDDAQPTSVTTMCLHKERLWTVDGSRREVWFSKSFQDDLGVAPGFTPDFRFLFDRDIIGLIGLDDKLVIFAADAIWILPGDGPAPNGANSDFGTPYRLQTDVGCDNPRSIVATPYGIMFQNDDALYLLTRGMEVEWAGKPVQDDLATYRYITSAVLVSRKNQVRFSANNNASTEAATSGIVLVYNYEEKQWSTFEYSDTSLAPPTTFATPIADACLWNGAYTFVTPNGSVYVESSASHYDAYDQTPEWVSMTLETAWWHAAGPLAYHSVRNFRLDGISATNHQLSVSVGFDGDTSYAQAPTTWGEGVAGVTTIGPIEHANVSIGTRRKCRSIRFKITDAAPVSTPGIGTGPIFDMMGIEVGVKRGMGAIPATQRK